jgi:hypothetical protein
MEQLDPEMLKNIDLLLVLDVLENEKDWDVVEDLDVIKKVDEEKTTNKEDEQWIEEDL